MIKDIVETIGQYMSYELISTHPIKKSDLGFHGNLFGGKLLAWLDASAAAFAAEFCDTPRMVTKAIDKCVFSKPNQRKPN